ncbi:MAG: SDR family oxidoreductase, partial [Myxococcales bacterium]|nr:SDR family oxidoreductase [Myxococcales bacterium]
TGANRGIGLALARQLVARGDRVIAAVRKASPELRALDLRIEEGVDVTDDSLGGLADRLGDTRLDVVLNNAGYLERDGLDGLDLAAIRRQFEINTLGPLKVTAAVLGHLAEGARVVHVTSRMGSVADNTSGGYYGYRMSKAALNMAAMSLAHDLRPRGVAVAVVHPGFVRTEMTGGQGLVDPPESAAGIVARLDELTLETSGGFWHAVTGEVLPW